MKNLLFLILFICSTWNILNAQQRVAPFSLGGKYIHNLDSALVLEDSMNIELENKAHNQSQQTQLKDLKNYIAGNTIVSENFHIQLSATVEIASSDTTITAASNPDYTKMYYDLDGDSILYDKTWVAGESTIILQLKKPNGNASNLPLWEDNRVSGNVQDPSSSNKTTCYAAVYSSGFIYIYYFVCPTGIYIQPMSTINGNALFVNFDLQVK